LHEAEWQTRRDRIDTKLRTLSLPWTIVSYKAGLVYSTLIAHAVTEYPTENGPADYALFVKGILIGIIEAKKVGVSPQNVLEQAKRYSKGAIDGAGNWQGYRVPFLYASNGEIIWFIDVRNEQAASRTLSLFHSPDALMEFYSRDDVSAFRWLADNPINIAGLRPYQKDAIAACEQALIERKRSMLIAMATGTGKTFTTVAQIYRLLRSNSARRILFLVDRKILAAQAVRAFASFNTPRANKFNQEYEVYSQRFRREDLDDENAEPFDVKLLPESYLTVPQSSHTFVYVSTIQRMAINLFGYQGCFPQNGSDTEDEEDASKQDIPIHTFDVIIADECHRGYTASETGIWRGVMDHFDAVKIGLTATPASHTLALFHHVAYRYSTEQAILDGFLVDYEAVAISSDVRINGVFLKEGEQVGWVDTETGQKTLDQLEDEREFSTEEIERKITAPDSNKKIIREIATYAREHQEQTGRFPKILIFAANDLPHTSHADQIVQLCRNEFGQGDAFVQKITGSPSVDRPLQRIREFRNRPNPKIVVTVDMLSTGVDIPAIEFIVFMRPVKSRILWTQMLGRGTRLCKEINKTHFVIFDCFDGTLIRYFANTTDFEIKNLQKEAVPLERVIENIYQNIDRDYNIKALVKRLRRIEKDMGGEARQQFAAYIPDGDMGKYAENLPEQILNHFTDTMNLLRNKAFQQLLLDYPRAPRSFVIGYDVQDEVSSGWVFKEGDTYKKPEDYLESFARFVLEEKNHIEAMQVLFNKPADWKPDVLVDLRNKLRMHQYPEEKLRKAHQMVHHKAMAEIISMVKYAADDSEPILTAEERVDRALAKVTSGKIFNIEQQQWLGLIREHLAQNLTIAIADFDEFPIFERHGGLGKARRLFAEQLEPFINEVNAAIAA